MTINLIAVLVAAVVQFIIGAIWYTPLFGKLWGKIHGFDTLNPEVQAEIQKKMMPLLVWQFVVTVVTTFVFALFIETLAAGWNVYGLAFHLWLGFVVPTQVGAVLFGGTKPEWIVTKIAIMAGGSLACLLAAAFVLSTL
mgnify:FL=1